MDSLFPLNRNHPASVWMIFHLSILITLLSYCSIWPIEDFVKTYTPYALHQLSPALLLFYKISLIIVNLRQFIPNFKENYLLFWVYTDILAKDYMSKYRTSHSSDWGSRSPTQFRSPLRTRYPQPDKILGPSIGNNILMNNIRIIFLEMPLTKQAFLKARIEKACGKFTLAR